MTMKFSKQATLERLRNERRAGKSLLTVGVGNGLSARCAEQGGADLAVVYNSGHYRVNGLESFVGLLPVGDANQIMLELGRSSILPSMRTIPIIAGVYGVDPTKDMNDVLDEVAAIGYSGVINFPTVGRHDGEDFGRELADAGYGFEREVEMIANANARGLFTMAYAYTERQSRLMAEVGVDVIVGHMGLTTGGDIGASKAVNLTEAAKKLDALFDAALAVKSDVIILSHGGPISSPEDAEFINLHSKAMGFVAASSYERIPVELALRKACSDFKGIRLAAS